MNETWYEDTAVASPGYPALRGDCEAEVCVIGAGLAGLTTALELAQGGRSVVLLEAGEVASGASGRNGGFLLPGFALGMEQVTKRVGREAGKALYALSQEGVDYVRARIAQFDPAIEMGRGCIVALRYPDADGLWREAEAAERDYGRRMEVWPVETTRACLMSERYHQALYDPEGTHIHPLSYARHLAAFAVAQGLRLHEASPAKALARDAKGYRVTTAAGSVRAGAVVLCTSGYGRGLYRPLDRALLPVATYIAVTEDLGERLDRAVATPAAVADTRRAGDYYRRVAGGRLLWGGRITTRQSQPARLAQAMAGDMASVYPQLAGARIDYAWSGLMGYCLHKMPLIAQLAPNLWVASGFGGHGLNTTAMAGCLIAGAIGKGDDRWRRFAPYGASWGGGPFSRIGVQASYWALQAKDRLEERRGASRARG
ncbi:MAG: FAD-binding oxidoreductase [Rhodospirillales bacterium]